MSADDSPPPRSVRQPSQSAALGAARTVLVVDDDDDTRRLIIRWLTRAGITCIEASNGEAAIAMATDKHDVVDAIVLDVMMPGIDGFETMARLKQGPTTAAIPIALLTAHANDDLDIVRGVEIGAVDHLEKPFSGPVLVAKVKALCERAHRERDLRHKLRYAEEHATIDALTKLNNRRSFEARFKEEVAHAKRHQQPFALVMLDIDHFKSVNDAFGHEEGDRVLIHVAEALRSVLRKEDAAFRYGGEEFVILLRASDAGSGFRVAERLHVALRSRAIALGEASEERVITFSAGVASADAGNGFEGAQLVARADAALYRAKRGGRDRSELAEG